MDRAIAVQSVVVRICHRSYNSTDFLPPSRSLGLPELPKILCITQPDTEAVRLPESLSDSYEVVEVQSSLRAIKLLSKGGFSGLFVSDTGLEDVLRFGNLLEKERILEGMPDGVALLDTDNIILWANDKFMQWAVDGKVIGNSFYQVMGKPDILGPDFCPFHTALATEAPSASTLRVNESHYFHVHAAPVIEQDDVPKNLIVTVRDITQETLQQQKLEAIHKAGIELADLTPEEVLAMELEERIDLLKSNILHYTQDLLRFDVIEIRLLDSKTGRLEPLLAVGIDDDARDRLLHAKAQGNGVTGFVAATGKSYLCEDTTQDPLYIDGLKGAKSSLTVPLIFHDQVIGSFNVESPETGAFTESDLQFLEIFSRDIAVALNTLELLVAQHANAALQSVEAIHGAVALPIDEILNDAVNVMERYIGHEPEVVTRLQGILKNARDIKEVIQKVGKKMTPSQALPESVRVEERPLLEGKRILVIDADESVRNDAHRLMERYGCTVETAHEGGEAIFMMRNCGDGMAYDAIIADIRLPDVSGYELFMKMKETCEAPPLVLMTGFGYDPGHSIVKARQAGLSASAILYKPFRLDQLLETVEAALTRTDNASARS